MHHLIGDGWSIELARSELSRLYEAAISGRSATLPALSIQQPDVAARERAFLDSDEARGALEWWRQRLADHPRITDAKAADRPFAGAATSRLVPARAVKRLTEIAHHHGVSLYIALLTAFHQQQMEREGRDDILVNTHLFNRPTEAERNLIGYFVNLLTLRAGLSRGLPFAEALRKVHVAWMEALEHALPIDEVVRALRPDLYAERYMPATAAFNMLSFAPVDAADGGALVKDPALAPAPGFLFFDQMLLVSPGPEGQLWFTLWYDQERITEAAAEKWVADLCDRVDALGGGRRGAK
jgi:hypothetical protein